MDLGQEPPQLGVHPFQGVLEFGDQEIGIHACTSFESARIAARQIASGRVFATML